MTETESETGLLVLLEPDENVRDALLALLQGQGWAVAFVHEPAGLTELLDSRDVTAVISETSLPICNANDILRVCMQRKVPVIFTGHGVPAQTAVDLVREGGHHYLEKPFRQERLFDLLNSMTNRHNG